MSIEIGEKILLLRTRLHITQDGLAKKINMRQGRLSEIETGHLKSPTWEELEQIANGLNVPIADVLPIGNTNTFNTYNNPNASIYNGTITIQLPLNNELGEKIQNLITNNLSK
jgi:transcriptional regulator with XRE-family HTH domain